MPIRNGQVYLASDRTRRDCYQRAFITAFYRYRDILEYARAEEKKKQKEFKVSPTAASGRAFLFFSLRARFTFHLAFPVFLSRERSRNGGGLTLELR